jgi:ribosome-associated toxin RatA of RatAB toxin-antitoxin module
MTLERDPHEPTVLVRLGTDGKPAGAAAQVRIDQPVAKVWAAVADVERLATFLPMVHRARRDGDRVTFELKFRIGFFSVGFHFTADATYEKEKWLELRWVSGEPKDVRLRFALTPAGDGACDVEGDGEFDLHSLGWLVKYFLKHHPEIQFGIFPGVALVLIDSLRRASSG